MKEPLQVDGTTHAKDQRVVQLKGGDQPVHNVRVGAFFDLQPHRVTFTPLRYLRVYVFQQAPAFFLFQIKIAVAGDAERRGSEDFVTAIELRRIRGDDVLKKGIVNAAILGGN